MFEKKLIQLLEEATNEFETHHKDTPDAYYNVSYYDLFNYIMNKLNSRLFIKRKSEIIVKHLDEIVPLVTQPSDNFLFLYLKSLSEVEGFPEKMAEGLIKYPYKEQLGQMLYMIKIGFMKEDMYEQILNQKLIEHLFSINMGSVFYLDLISGVSEEKQKEMLITSSKYKCSIPYNAIQYKGNNKNIIYDNIDDFIKSERNLYTLRDFVKDKPELYSKVCDYINSNEDRAIESIINSYEDNCGDYRPIIKDSTINQVLGMLVKEIKVEEKVNYSDINYVYNGAYSFVLLVGEKVIKIGGRSTKNIPGNPYIVAPLLRKEIISGDNSAFIEVTEKVDTSKSATTEELYELYKNLRDLGIIWTDIKQSNVGRLKKENVIHWNEQLNPADNARGFTSYRGNKVLKEGDLVIIDSDFIYDEYDPDINYTPGTAYQPSFEARYQKEKEEAEKRKKALVIEEAFNVEPYEKVSEQRSGFSK